MYLKYLDLSFIIVTMVGLIGCAAHNMDEVWPKPRHLGKEVKTYKPPPQPSAVDLKSLRLEEPTESITLRQALSLALMNNPELKAFSWEVRAGEARTLQASLLPNPELELEMEEFYGSGDLSGFEAAGTTIQLSQLIELGGKRPKRRRVAELERDLAGWDYEAKRIEVFTEVTRAFVEVLAGQERLNMREELVKLSGQVLHTVSERVKAGADSPVEVTKAEVAVAVSRIELRQARSDLEVARKLLAATWGSTSPIFEKVEGRLEDISPIPSLGQLEQLISQNPNIARWAVEIELNRAASDMEKAGRIPDLTIGGGLQYFNETNENAFVAVASIPLPLFDRNQGGILEARYALARAREEKNAAKVSVRTALSESYQILSAAFSEVMALKNTVLPGAESAFDAISEGYAQGKFNYLEVLDTQRSLFEAKSQYVEALASYHEAIAEIEYLIGEPLGGIENTSNKNETEEADDVK